MTSDEYMPIERYYALKAMFERIWGKGTYLDLKHCSDLMVWKRYCERTLRATEMAVSETVLISDDEWHKELSEIIEHGIRGLKSAKDFDDLFQYFAAAYAEISFHQIGLMPSVNPATRSQLRKRNWRLDAFRSVQYVQNIEQKESLTKRRMKREATWPPTSPFRPFPSLTPATVVRPSRTSLACGQCRYAPLNGGASNIS